MNDRTARRMVLAAFSLLCALVALYVLFEVVEDEPSQDYTPRTSRQIFDDAFEDYWTALDEPARTQECYRYLNLREDFIAELDAGLADEQVHWALIAHEKKCRK